MPPVRPPSLRPVTAVLAFLLGLASSAFDSAAAGSEAQPSYLAQAPTKPAPVPGPGSPGTSPTLHRHIPLSLPASGRTGFTLLPPSSTGVTFTNTLPLARALENNNLLNGSGLALGDVNGDGRVDIYLCHLAGPNALYLNRGNLRFEAVPNAGGADCTDLASTGAVLADVTGNGHLDLLVNHLGQGLRHFLNNGHGQFTESPDNGLERRYGGSSLALGDLDGDGWLDLYAANYADVSALRSGGALTFRWVEGRPVPTGPYAHRLRMVDGQWTEFGDPDGVYRNLGNGRFQALDWTSGAFLDSDGRPLSEPPAELALSVMIRDLNQDGHPDLYVCNDFQFSDRIWINRGDGTFQALPKLAIRSLSHFSMAVDAADLNRDGHDDLFIADMLSRNHRLRMRQMGILNPPPRIIGQYDDRPLIRRNTLFLNRGDGSYADVAPFSGVDASDWTWSAAFLDVDLDGFEDLLIGNGHAFDIQDLDAIEAMSRRQTRGRPSVQQSRENLLLFPRLQTPNVAFRNRGDLTFEEVGADWGFHSTQVSHGMALGDLDGDGDLDVVINCLNEGVLVYRNESIAPRLAVQLRGLPPNTRGIGARLTLRGGAVPLQSQELQAGGRYLSSDQPLRTFAANRLGQPMSLEVLWPSGLRSLIPVLHSNLLVEVHEPSTHPASTPSKGRDAPPGRPPEPSTSIQSPFPHFQDLSSLLNHRHLDEPFDDFARQPLLPRRLSQSGPAVAWLDLDGDGLEDLVIGSGRGGSPVFLRNPGRAQPFLPLPNTSSILNSPSPRDQSGIVGFSISNAQPQVLIGLSNWEDAQPDGPQLLRFDGSPALSPLDLDSFPGGVGPLALGALDGPGSLTLFVGSRVLPARYPEGGGGRLYHWRDGVWHRNPDPTLDQALASAGMVSGALFTDLTGDGTPELVLACEWGPVRIFARAPDGRWLEQTAAWGLQAWTGWWNGVASADLDADGRLDLIVSNWGRNTGFRTDTQHPLHLFHGEFLQPGLVHMIEAQWAPELSKLAPLRDLLVLGTVLPPLRSIAPTHQQFAELGINDLFGPRLYERTPLTVHTLDSMIFLNRGQRMEARPLPAEAQWSPAFAVVTADFDGDSHEDVFLSLNFFATAPDRPRLDNGLGLWLRGDGQGNLAAVPAAQSGLRVYGEQRGAAASDFDGDARVDLVVTQNGAETRLFRNAGAQPGWRIRIDGPPHNPQGVGTQMRWIHPGNRRGPVREIQAGSGYLSQNSAVQVLGASEPPETLWIRWPGGRELEVPLPGGIREIRIPYVP